MPRFARSFALRKTPTRSLLPIYAAILLLIFHTFVVAYINSSFLEEFIDAASVGSVFTIGSALSVVIFLLISKVLHRFGNFKLTVALLLVNFGAVLGLSQANMLEIVVPLFIVHVITVPLIIFNLDVFMEERIGDDESGTGSSRGLLLTLASLVGAVSPLISGQIVALSGGDFSNAYIVSALTIVPVLVILFVYFRHFNDPAYTAIRVGPAIKTFWRNLNVRNVFIAHFLLQMFFMMMVVYTPLYLTGTIGLSWAEFGIIMFFAQLAYVFLEYPIGIIADRFIGEKEMMAVGFLIIIMSTAAMSFFSVASVLVWSVLMFITRVGAALVEVTTESYFFKQTKSSDAQIISFFRITRPLAYVLGALVATVALWFVPFNWLFIVFAACMVPAMFATLYIVDSK